MKTKMCNRQSHSVYAFLDPLAPSLSLSLSLIHHYHQRYGHDRLSISLKGLLVNNTCVRSSKCPERATSREMNNTEAHNSTVAYNLTLEVRITLGTTLGMSMHTLYCI